jgi:hypothetical protein
MGRFSPPGVVRKTPAIERHEWLWLFYFGSQQAGRLRGWGGT